MHTWRGSFIRDTTHSLVISLVHMWRDSCMHPMTHPSSRDVTDSYVKSIIHTGHESWSTGLANAHQRLVCCSVLQCVAVCCSVLQCVAVCCCPSKTAEVVYHSVLQCVAVCHSVLQCVTVCCSVSQCVAVCCSVSQSVAVCGYPQKPADTWSILMCASTDFGIRLLLAWLLAFAFAQQQRKGCCCGEAAKKKVKVTASANSDMNLVESSCEWDMLLRLDRNPPPPPGGFPF